MSASVIHGDLNYIEEPHELDTPEDGWDIVRWKEVVTAGSADAARAMFPKGRQISGYAFMFISGVRVKELVCGLGAFSCEITGKGIATNKWKIKWRTLTERNSYGAVTITGYLAIPGKADIAEPRVGATLRWFSNGYPNMSIVGAQINPSYIVYGSTPDVPPDLWSAITDGVVNYPRYWVLDSRDAEELQGSGMWMVEDSLSYYQPVRPSK